ncbi:hypothetical protein BCR34DRAFT_606408 [Clohesyomyces aquaticus]|uniref:Uncharacterized protein n=1 Tax=Clohesyomyces aquaticus TaxID=1231657 RepID=A0A1Y1YPP9_9PLEO|nr:hypothetical protein BCR34DRAFT_606408 [Clohesyomyces aquaticus]
MSPLHPAFQLQRSATKYEAQRAAGHDYNHWGRFYTITLREAKNVFEEDPNMTWLHVTAPKKQEIMDRVNSRLRDEQIPEVGYDILSWRMSNTLKNLRAQAIASSKEKEKKKKSESQSATDSTPAGSAGTLMFDPVRDY